MEKVPYEKLRSFNRRAIGPVMAATSIFMAGNSSENTPPRLPEGTKWVVGGDSFSSGHAGLERERIYGVYEDCFVDEISYAKQAADMLGVEESNFTNAACSGATIEDIEQGRFDQPSQLDYIDETTDYVVLTAGGNEADLSELMHACMNDGCNTEQEVVRRTLEAVSSDDFKQRLTDLYIKMAEKAENGNIMVVEYPDIVNTDAILWRLCATQIDPEMAGFVEVFVDTMNDSIGEAVAEAQRQGYRVHLVDQAKSTHVCHPSNLIFGESINTNDDEPRSMIHPTEKGHLAMAKKLMQAIVNIERNKRYNESKDSFVVEGDISSYEYISENHRRRDTSSQDIRRPAGAGISGHSPSDAGSHSRDPEDAFRVRLGYEPKKLSKLDERVPSHR